MTIKQIILNANDYDGQKISISGWIFSLRGNLNIKFLELNDGSTVANLQVVLKKENIDLEIVDKAREGASISITGLLKYTPDAKQSVELHAISFELLKNTDEDFPIQKKEISMEVLREIPHLRHRTRLIKAVMLIRSTLALEIHNFFAKNNFLYVSSPIITSNDGEGAGETFVVDDESKEHFFGKKATLGVTGQLHAEAYAIGMQKVYTFAPTFRAEKSHTKKHAAEFWMVEPEVAFYKLNDIILLADQMLKEVISKTLVVNKLEFDFLEKNYDSNLREKLNLFLNKKLSIIDYKQAIEELKKVKDTFEEKNIEFGLDLATEHEKYLAEKLFNGPVAVINYPKDFKAFYMYQNDDNKTVAAFDLLVPGIGELIGGSQRESRYDKLLNRINELSIPADDLKWYLDLRRFGDSGSAGFGLGFERLIMYVTGVDNIRDVIPFPRTPNNLKM
ncbi:asparagine--tRNA ligase [Mesomycoplasma lagogenitalium]|uniref:Asparagine--tRNA ligase n=1 Tax=Mesomycoplasma lagogenitalium TaxID=171286 RepID=A0ABY8LVX7_9BACT|nr:asparagine--tRNA ligase [Mesomycoplasma lagogenitalium]WGI36960.1 asparagine--tRNA ligase [Mesomycoplasma lagogenitalium]